MKIVNAVAMSGGFTYRARKQRFLVRRAGAPKDSETEAKPMIFSIPAMSSGFPNGSSEFARIALSRLERMPAVIAVVALCLLAIGGVRLPADLIALPGSLSAT